MNSLNLLSKKNDSPHSVNLGQCGYKDDLLELLQTAALRFRNNFQYLDPDGFSDCFSTFS